ncbi:MAG: hypothetical protein K8S87_02020 [Planctomycetes bacterium]|nr:hypothetical protein [Planctomycetota bacterium]
MPATFIYLQIGRFPLVLPFFLLTIPFMLLMPVFLLVLLLLMPSNSRGCLRKVRQLWGIYRVLCTMRNLQIHINKKKETTNEKSKKILIYVL